MCGLLSVCLLLCVLFFVVVVVLLLLLFWGDYVYHSQYKTDRAATVSKMTNFMKKTVGWFLPLQSQVDFVINLVN